MAAAAGRLGDAGEAAAPCQLPVGGPPISRPNRQMATGLTINRTARRVRPGSGVSGQSSRRLRLSNGRHSKRTPMPICEGVVDRSSGCAEARETRVTNARNARHERLLRARQTVGPSNVPAGVSREERVVGLPSTPFAQEAPSTDGSTSCCTYNRLLGSHHWPFGSGHRDPEADYESNAAERTAHGSDRSNGDGHAWCASRGR